MGYRPENLRRWKMPDSYFGAEWPEYYVASSHHRDSDVLQESNFFSMLKMLGGESETVRVIRESHWAVGWVEWIGIHQSDELRMRAADNALGQLEDYPILDDSDFSERETHECEVMWSKGFALSDRIRYLRDHGCTTDFRELRAAVNGDWTAAANLLPSPSDILT